MGHHIEHVTAALVVKEGQQQLDGLVGADDLQLVTVLDVHHLIADVVGSLDQIDQRVARIALRSQSHQTQFGGDALKDLLLASEETKFAFRTGLR